MEVHVQDGLNSSRDISTHDQSDNFNDVGWASFPVVNDEEHIRRVR